MSSVHKKRKNGTTIQQKNVVKKYEHSVRENPFEQIYCGNCEIIKG